MNKLQKSALIGIGALVLSTLAIQASDVVSGLNTNLSGLVSESGGPCNLGEVQILLGSQALCVDMFEASPADECPNKEISSQVSTQENINESACAPQTVKDEQPWRYVSFTQAQQLCARVGKRLPDNDEWYTIASGMTDESSCVTDGGSGPSRTGSSECVTPSGVYDMVGNVWEWVDEEVIDGVYNSRQLPEEGYVQLVDTNGIVIETGKNASLDYGSDYAWTKDSGVFGMIRGGFYGSGNDAGIFAQNMAVPLDFKTVGIGFRCVRNI